MLVAFAPSNEFQSTLPRGERLLHKLCIGLLSYISIHAPARGATPLLLCITLGYRISIHAPARGATLTGLLAGINRTNFNPRSREGSDFACEIPSARLGLFQSTLPRGERPLIPYSEEYSKISIHAPARGATQAAGRLQRIHADFNPRSREGSDEVIKIRLIVNKDFNPRSREGSDKTAIKVTKFTPISIHAPARGATGSWKKPLKR